MFNNTITGTTLMKRRTLSFLIFAICFLQFAFSANQIPAKKQTKPVALYGATIHPVVGEAIENGLITFRNGKIEYVGKQYPLTPEYERIEVKGKHIYPGLFNAGTNIGLMEIGAVRATRDINETGRINPNVRAEVALNPESELIPVTRANGVTTSLVLPAGGAISGLGAIINLDGWTWEDMTVKSRAAMVVNWPNMSINTSPRERRTEDEQKKDRQKSLNEISDAFNDAKAYWTAKKNGTGKTYHEFDLRWEAMIPVLEKKVPVLVSADDAQQIEAAVAWANEADVKLIIYGGTDAWRVSGLLKKNNVPVVIGGILTLPTRLWDAYDEAYILPKKLSEAGVQYCISANELGNGNDRNLPYHAAMAAAYGLNHDEAIKAITLYPAQIFGVADSMGSLEVKKSATLFVTDGDPLDVRSHVEMEFIDGKKIDISSRHTMLYDKYRVRYGKK